MSENGIDAAGEGRIQCAKWPSRNLDSSLLQFDKTRLAAVAGIRRHRFRSCVQMALHTGQHPRLFAAITREKRRKVKVKLADGKERTIQHMSTTSIWSPDGKPVSAAEFIQCLFGDLSALFKDEDELRALWCRRWHFRMNGENSRA